MVGKGTELCQNDDNMQWLRYIDIYLDHVAKIGFNKHGYGTQDSQAGRLPSLNHHGADKKNVSYKFDSALNRKTTREIVWQKM